MLTYRLLRADSQTMSLSLKAFGRQTHLYFRSISGKNKAGYTAISRVRLGRGSNAQKSTKKLFLRKRDQRTNGRTDTPSYGVTLRD